MYINDIHLLNYIIIGVIGFFVGIFTGWCNDRLPDYKKIFTKEIFTKIKPNYILGVVTAAIYMLLLYKFGIKPDIISNLPLLEFLLLTPMLLCAFCVDYKLQIIPNRLSLTIFELGIIFTFILGIINFNLAKDAI